MPRVSASGAARKAPSAVAPRKSSPTTEPRPEASPGPEPSPPEPVPPPPRSGPRFKADLAALDMARLSRGWPSAPEERTLAEVYARTFDIGEDDPAQSVALMLADYLLLMRMAGENAENPPSDSLMERAFFRASSLAELAAELHRRQRAALLDALAVSNGGA